MDTNSNKPKSIKRKVVDQLVQGHEFATKLKLLLSNHHIDETRRIITGTGLVYGEPDPVYELIAKILSSFHQTISVLDSCELFTEDVSIAVEGSRNASCGDDSAAPANYSGGDSVVDSRKRLGVRKGKRGCYTRKKKLHTWTMEARRFDEDRYAWRKYGQKEILNTNFPRSYFRCTHKPTQGCKATKQVQKQEHNPEMFQITYIGRHTCNAFNDQTQAKTELFEHETTMDSSKTLAPAIVQGNVNAKVLVSEGIMKEEANSYNCDDSKNKDYCEGSSTNGDALSLVWQDVMMFDDDDQHHHNDHYNYHHGETSTTSNQFSFIDNDHLSSLFDSYCDYEETSAMYEHPYESL
ncbi:unnamed protein product [Cochlearia groenlandica]